MQSPVICSSCLLRSPNGKQEDDERSHAENDSGDPGNFDVEGPSWIK
jgi:hypothetical protein